MQDPQQDGECTGCTSFFSVFSCFLAYFFLHNVSGRQTEEARHNVLNLAFEETDFFVLFFLSYTVLCYRYNPLGRWARTSIPSLFYSIYSILSFAYICVSTASIPLFCHPHFIHTLPHCLSHLFVCLQFERLCWFVAPNN